jgi:hypothetical protein
MDKRLKAFKIKTQLDRGFSIQIAETAGSAKSQVVRELQDCYRNATYSWITSCRRVPEFDYLVDIGHSGCVAWSHEGERWQIDRGHWWHGDDVSPVDNVFPAFVMGLDVPT